MRWYPVVRKQGGEAMICASDFGTRKQAEEYGAQYGEVIGFLRMKDQDRNPISGTIRMA